LPSNTCYILTFLFPISCHRRGLTFLILTLLFPPLLSSSIWCHNLQLNSNPVFIVTMKCYNIVY
jgi:hypothetical protein